MKVKLYDIIDESIKTVKDLQTDFEKSDNLTEQVTLLQQINTATKQLVRFLES